ncbi:hypothetical protein [Cellulomonas sp. PhB150]|uniref:hypothetical protein n=1 Tax=Cellulomonas sp. PhB150 TaxID=2485188 RepID=UPI000F4A1932|nr:hypothetical protein [Cellulomonas sp. PhB150]ROS23978.1 hypothetical protein EDF34_3041 [Cellulomonas sp. PhB150]
MQFIRFQSATPNARGTFPGVFALANGLARDGRLSDDDRRWLRESNARCDAAYTDPTTVVPECYDRTAHPGARSWFKTTAGHLLDLTAPYLDLLDRYGVAWVRLTTDDPGRVTYEDDVQVVAV